MRVVSCPTSYLDILRKEKASHPSPRQPVLLVVSEPLRDLPPTPINERQKGQMKVR